MRKIPIEYIRDGQILQRSVYNKSGHILINQGEKLDASLIHKLKSLGVISVYIQDQYSHHEVEEIIKPQLRSKFLSNNLKLSKLFIEKSVSPQTSNINKKANSLIADINSFLDDVTQDALNSKDVLNNLISVSTYDDCTFEHSLNVMILSIALANGLKMQTNEIKKIALGCLLHDFGKLYVPLEIINKKGKLDPEEFNIIKNHPVKGYEFLTYCTNLSIAERIIALSHHEKWDGTGYPYGKNKEDIHLNGRICSICDVFEALTADRAYRKGIKPNEALKYIMGNGNILFDYELVKIFVSSINIYPVGTMVLLSNGCEGVVEQVNETLMRPTIKVFCENSQKVEPYYIDLMKVWDVVIKDIIYKFSCDN